MDKGRRQCLSVSTCLGITTIHSSDFAWEQELERTLNQLEVVRTTAKQKETAAEDEHQRLQLDIAAMEQEIK